MVWGRPGGTGLAERSGYYRRAAIGMHSAGCNRCSQRILFWRAVRNHGAWTSARNYLRIRYQFGLPGYHFPASMLGAWEVEARKIRLYTLEGTAIRSGI